MNTAYNKLNISALDIFKLNRYYKFNDITSNIRVAGTLKDSSYLNIEIDDDNTYIRANNSSPLNDNNELLSSGLSEVCIKYKDNNEYKYFPFYIGYSLTYTQSVEVNGINTYLYAFSHINGISNINTIVETMNINVIHNPKNSQESVNVYSDVTYSLCNITGSLINNSTINLTAGNIKSIIDSNNCGSSLFDISYSYITPDDGYIHDDGKCIVDELTGVHVWSMNSYIDDEQYSYQYTDYNSTEPFIVYTYINASKILLDKLENSGIDYLSYALVDVSDDNWWSQDNFKFVKTSNNQAYLMYEETKQQYFNHLRPYNLTYNGNCVVNYREPFSNIYRYASWRDNKDYYYACQKMMTYVGNLSSIYPKFSDNFNNFNTSYFIKKIGNLPVHIVPPYLKLKISCNNLLINGNNSGNLHILHNLIINSIDFRIESRINQDNPNTTQEDLSIPINVEFKFETLSTNNYLKAYVYDISHTSNIGSNEYIKEIICDISQSSPSAGNEEISSIEITFNMYKIYERIENYSSFIKEIYTQINHAAVQLNTITNYTEITTRGLYILEPSQPEYDYAYSNSAISTDEIYINAVFNNTDGK